MAINFEGKKKRVEKKGVEAGQAPEAATLDEILAAENLCVVAVGEDALGDDEEKEFGIDPEELEKELEKLNKGEVPFVTLKTKNGTVMIGDPKQIDNELAKELHKLADKVEKGEAGGPNQLKSEAVGFGEHRNGEGRAGSVAIAYTNGSKEDAQKLREMADKIASGQMRKEVLSNAPWKKQSFGASIADMGRDMNQKKKEAMREARGMAHGNKEIENSGSVVLGEQNALVISIKDQDALADNPAVRTSAVQETKNAVRPSTIKVTERPL